MSTNRLDRANYGGPLLQGLLFKALRQPKDDWIKHTVQPNEEYDIYKISYNAYGTVDVWWVIAVCAKLDDPMKKIDAGTELTIPPLSWVREKLKNPGRTIND